MNCKGFVTKINYFIGYFYIDNKYRVNLGILKANNDEVKLPALNSRVTARKLHKSSNIYIACSNTILEGTFTEDFTSNSFINIIKTSKLGAGDLVKSIQIFDLLEKNYSFENACLKEKVYIMLLESLINLHKSSVYYGSQPCLNSIISPIEVFCVSSCKFVDIISEKFQKFPPWSFGVRSKHTKNANLFGFLYVDPQYGFFLLKDDHHRIVCNITNKTFSIDHLHNSYVLLRNYQIITEIYKDSDVPNLEYLLLNFHDIIVIHTVEEHRRMYGTSVPLDRKFEYTLEFLIIRKSTMCISQNKNAEMYLQVLVTRKNNTEVNQMQFLTLSLDYATILVNLNEGFKYNLFHNSPLKELENSELSLIQKLKNYKIEDSDAYFQELGTGDNSSYNKVINVKDYKSDMSKSSSLVSLEGVLRNRNFVKSFSQTAKRTSLYGFSTPGKDTHTLVFNYEENGSVLNLIVYLSNWTNQLMPLGLIPQMRVRVNNVQPKSKYVKTTIFSTIEIISYEPLVNFQTVNLFENFEVDWGPSYFLSKGNQIPYGVIVWSKIFNIHILQLNMTNRCMSCENVLETLKACRHCECEERNFRFSLVMHVTDEYGISKVIVKDRNFLKIILDLTQKQFGLWLEAFLSVGEYTFNIHDQENQFDNMFESNNFKNLLSQYFINFNKSLTDGIDLKCRKMFTKKEKSNGRTQYPHWFYLDSRN